MSVTYDAVLDMSDDGVGFPAELLAAERMRRGTRSNTRALCMPAQVFQPDSETLLGIGGPWRGS